MMKNFSLDDKEQTRRDELSASLREALERLNSAITDYNNATLELRDSVESALKDYNDELTEARNFVEEIAGRARLDLDDKDEEWVESNKGQIADTWTEEWEDVDLGELEVDWPQELSVDEPDHADDLDSLPTEVMEDTSDE